MIISASRKTDIPAYYSEWFENRIKEGYVLVRNPMNIHQISKISLAPEVVDGIVFWTKNPIPMIKRLDAFSDYTYYFQFTLTSYGKDIEAGLPSKKQDLIPTFCDLSRKIGRERVVWRYDPILINEVYTVEYHKKYFKTLAAKIGPYIEKCTVSFIDLYRNTERNIRSLGIRVPSREEEMDIMTTFVEIAKEHGFYIDTCAEEVDLSSLGIKHAHCIEQERFERIGNYNLEVEKDPNQRDVCGCISSIDIGTYNTCKNGCAYCYANFGKVTVANQTSNHKPLSPLLFGEVGDDDVIKDRKMESLINRQITLFDI